MAEYVRPSDLTLDGLVAKRAAGSIRDDNPIDAVVEAHRELWAVNTLLHNLDDYIDNPDRLGDPGERRLLHRALDGACEATSTITHSLGAWFAPAIAARETIDEEADADGGA